MKDKRPFWVRVKGFVRLLPFWWCKHRHTAFHRDYYSDYGKEYFRCEQCGRGHSRVHRRLQPNATLHLPTEAQRKEVR